jgi:serine phosphatase RsbU (regulator of sigma subunit)/tetratricopeptide (TPR) repeat protein
LNNRFYIFLIFFALSIFGKAQQAIIDSLKAALKSAKNDTIRINILKELIDAENDSNIWGAYNDQMLSLSEKGLASSNTGSALKYFYLKSSASAFNNIGFIANNHGDITKALMYYQKSLKIQEEIKDKSGIANSSNNIGYVYNSLGDIPKALDYYHKSLRIYEQMLAENKNSPDAPNFKKGIAYSLNNIGQIYLNQGEITKSMDFYNRSLKIREELKDIKGISQSLNNIGFALYNHGDPSCKESKEICIKEGRLKAFEYYTRSLKLREEVNDQRGIAISLSNIGGAYSDMGDPECKASKEECLRAGKNKALEYFQRSLTILEELKDKWGIANSLNDIGTILLEQQRIVEAKVYANRSFQTSKELGYPVNIKKASSLLKRIYKEQKKYKEALAMYELEIQMRDSITNEETKKSSIKKQFQYEYEKKAAADSIKNTEEQKVKNAQLTAQQAQLKQERTQRFALYGGLILVLIFAAIMFNRYKITQQQRNTIALQKTKVDEAYIELNKQNEEIATQRDEIGKQKHSLEAHQKEIIDSITYAKRLQEAILPSKAFITEHFPENFILYKPKDLVAGDFYWAEFYQDKFLIAAADSTGHGVPGAIVSVVCSNALNRSLKEFGLTDPGLLLDKTRELVLETFAKSSSDVKDGMDISILCIDKYNKKVSWAGANNPLWYLFPEEKILSEIKANKQPIGKADNPMPFTSHEIEYEEGILFYLITDGYADQFGGPKGKKFKYKSLKDLLITHAPASMEKQSELLINTFSNWKGNLEQVDDVCIIGIRI